MTDIYANDTVYKYHYWKYDEESLLHSIRENGIQTPLLLEKIKKGYRIINGFRRFHCAETSGIDVIPGIIPGESGLLSNLRQSLIDNRTKGSFNIYEQSMAMSVAHNLGATTSQIISGFLPLLGLNAHKNVYNDYLGFHRLPDPLIDFFVEKDIAVSRSLAFQRLDEKGLKISLDLLKNFSPGINVLHEIVTNLYELSRRDEKTIEEIYTTLSVSEILEKNPQPHLALNELRTQIQKYRYPVLAETNRQLQQLADKLSLKPTRQFQWDKKLERRGVTVTFHWDGPEDIKKTVESLSEEKNLSILRQIFDRI